MGTRVDRCSIRLSVFLFFFFNDTATTEIYTLSLHDALPISQSTSYSTPLATIPFSVSRSTPLDRKSTRLNSSHYNISYAVFCLKKKTTRMETDTTTPLRRHVRSNEVAGSTH